MVDTVCMTTYLIDITVDYIYSMVQDVLLPLVLFIAVLWPFLCTKQKMIWLVYDKLSYWPEQS